MDVGDVFPLLTKAFHEVNVWWDRRDNSEACLGGKADGYLN